MDVAGVAVFALTNQRDLGGRMYEIGTGISEGLSMPRRRRLLTFGASAAVVAAQPIRRAWAAGPARIGVLYFGNGQMETVGGARVFDTAIAELGRRPGTDVIIESRYGTAPDVLPRHADELVRMKVDVLVALGPAPLGALRAATSSIPIVAVAGRDPVREGWARSLARPQGNVTGLCVTFPELQVKEMELLKEAFPAVQHIAVLIAPAGADVADAMAPLWAAAPGLGLRLRIIEMRGPDAFEPPFEAARREGAQALIAPSVNQIVAHRARLAQLALRQEWPSIADFSLMADAGFLMSYGADLLDLIRRSALHVDRILKGASPGELAIERPTRFQLTMNRATLRALGVAPAQAVMSRVDKFVQ